MKKIEKSFFIQNLTEELKSANAAILVDFAGLNVKNQQDLKKRLKTVNAKILIVKNTLFKLAAESADSPKEISSDTVLQGPNALITTEDDAIAPLQIIYKFAKEKELPHLKVGVIEGIVYDKPGLEKLANLPSKNVLFAQATGAISAPLYGMIGVLSGKMQEFLSILDQYSKSKTN